jgi:hypothetical protein
MTDTTHAAPTTVRRLTTPAALALADHAGRFEDLQTVLRCCERLLSELSADPDDLLVEGLWTTALTSYARCFAAGGAGGGLTPQDVAGTGLGGDVLQWHHVLLKLSEHYTGGADNPRESFAVGASQDPTGRAAGIAITSARRPRVDEVTVRQTGAVAFALSRVVDRKIGEQQQVVFRAVAAMTGEELGRLPVVAVGPPEAGPGD